MYKYFFPRIIADESYISIAEDEEIQLEEANRRAEIAEKLIAEERMRADSAEKLIAEERMRAEASDAENAILRELLRKNGIDFTVT